MPARFIISFIVTVVIGLGASGITLAHSSTGTNVLYQVSWPGGATGWTASGPWRTGGRMLTNTSDDASTFVAPYVPAGDSYAIEARIRLVTWRHSSDSENNAFGVLFRAGGSGGGNPATGLVAGVARGFLGCDGLYSWAAIATADNDTEVFKESSRFRPGKGWHMYRVEVRHNQMKLLVDGHVRNVITSTRFIRQTRVGLFSLASRIQVRGFKVLGL